MNVLYIELDAGEDLFVVIAQESLDGVALVGGHVLAVPVPVDGPGAGLSSGDRAASADQTVATDSDILREEDGLVQHRLVVEDQKTSWAEVLDVIG